jgi:alkylation response protein AidB-like acyl-CoA dehydrogenase
MTQKITDPRKDTLFVLLHQLGIQSHEAGLDEETTKMLLEEAYKLAVGAILPTNKDGDSPGCIFINGQVKVPESYHPAWAALCEGGWLAMVDREINGGQELPICLDTAVKEPIIGANLGFSIQSGLTHGAAGLIEEFGSAEQKILFLKNMLTGKWAGTMLLTESGAGTDVGALTTKAILQEDGSYLITGEKIFISGGDHDLTPNIIHPVLARIEGAPAGTKGISLFLVPKILVNNDGGLGEANNITCSGIEHKMGIHGSPTCTMVMDDARGSLLGVENKGMSHMFQMMNEARFLVGTQGFAMASTAYATALAYAKERIQGASLTTGKQVAIINHPDVRRMLMWMKSHVDGMRSLVLYTGFLFDQAKIAEDEEKIKLQGLIDLLIPIVKAYCTGKGTEVCDKAVQVLGGYGYCKEYPVEQMLRDVRITPTYEGTNGIQAMDLLHRKIFGTKLATLGTLLDEITKTTDQAKKFEELIPAAGFILESTAKLMGSTKALGETAMKGNLPRAFCHATPYLEAAGDIVMSWMHLQRAVAALTAKDELGDKQVEGIVLTAQFFINTVLPQADKTLVTILEMDDSAIQINEDSL